MSRRRTARRAPLLAAGAFLALAFVGLGACRGVVAGDGVDAAADLCSVLDRCYGRDADACASLLGGRFGDRTQDDDLFVDRYGALRCNETCSGALGCLSLAPVCSPIGVGCDRKEECCGGAFGEAGCSQGGTCCRAQRQLCKDDPGACCGGASECRAVNGIFTCGGVPPCSSLGETCAIDRDCCSNSCDPDTLVCRRAPCAEIGAPCLGAECCNPDATCEDDVCVLRGTACVGSSCDPTSTPAGGPAEGCCPDHPVCFPLVNGVDGGCGAVDCRPPGASCDEDRACCGQPEGETAFCDRTFGEGVCAIFKGACGLAGSACMDDGACCSGHCSGETCAASPRVICSEADCGNTCVAGPPKNPDACSMPSPRTDCIRDVCAIAESCCCTEWDAVCITIASELVACTSC